MVYAVLGVLGFAVYVIAARAAERGSDLGRFGAIWTASMLLVGATVVALLAVDSRAITCDENCDASTQEWWHTDDAWQWTAQEIVAVLGLAAVAALLLLTIRRRYAAAFLAAGGAVTCFGAWALMAPLGG